jgi:hypothetical protein
LLDEYVRTYKRNTVALSTVFVVLAVIFSAPALASNISLIPCSKPASAALNVPTNVLAARVVNHDSPSSTIDNDTASVKVDVRSASGLLAPRAEAAIRHAFESSEMAVTDSSSAVPARLLRTPPMAGTDSKSEPPAADEDSHTDQESGMNTKLPGISDDDLVRYKKQMYRRDI